MTLVIGTSGWQYRHWRGAFYPQGLAQRRWLEYYAERFATVEVNNTFYRLPDRAVFASWAERVPDGFCFALKMSRYLSHVERLKAPTEAVHRFVERAEPLGSHRGPTLVQLPPNLRVDLPRLVAVLEAWPADLRLAIEFRHDSWYQPEVRDLLTAHEVALCLTDRRGRRLQPLWRTAPWTYVRFHEGTRSNRYTAATLARWLGDLEARWHPTEPVFVYFNNDGGGAAPHDARALAELSGTSLPTPG